jgi:SAM-dependent methyltransferase
MSPSADVIRASYRIASDADARGDGDDRVEPTALRLLAELPLRSRVLEIGCGTGAFTRELASKRGARITAIDIAPRMIDVARVRTPASFGIEYCVADFLELSPRGFEVAVAVDVLHALPLAQAAARMAEAVVPGGLVLIADGFDASGVGELPYHGLSWLLRRPPPAPARFADGSECGPRDHARTLRVIRNVLRDVLPGVSVRRHLGWRYTAIWRKPI